MIKDGVLHQQSPDTAMCKHGNFTNSCQTCGTENQEAEAEQELENGLLQAVMQKILAIRHH